MIVSATKEMTATILEISSNVAQAASGVQDVNASVNQLRARLY
nr:hypothetical protein [uncultured Desulfobacter sp.]